MSAEAASKNSSAADEQKRPAIRRGTIGIGSCRAGPAGLHHSGTWEGSTFCAPERARAIEQVDFSRPYALNGVAIFVRKGNTSINGLDDLTGKKIAVSEGTVQAEFARTRIRDAKVKTYRNATLVLTDLSWGRADAALVSRFQGTYLAARKGLAITPVGPVWHNYVLRMSFHKGSPAFKQAVDTAINDMIRDGTLSAISRRWLNGLDMATELHNLPPDEAT